MARGRMLGRNAAFLYTDPATGQDVVIDLPAPLRDIRTRVVQRRYVEEALDGTRSVKTIGPAHYELIGRIRFVDAPDAMLAMLHAAANGAQLVYTEDVTDPHAKTYAAELIWNEEAIELGMDADLGKIGRGEVTVVLRSSVPWGALYAGPDVLFRYRAGEPLSAAGMTFSRASTATLIDRTGTLREVGPDVPRIDWSHGRPALRLEGARTNGWTWSEDLSQSVWIKDGISVMTNVATAPDGQVTMDKVVEDATTGVHYIRRALSGASDNATQAISFWVAAAERTWVRIGTSRKNSTAVASSYFNLATGEFGTVNAAHSLRIIERVGSAYRFECVFDVGSGAETPQFRVGPTTGDATSTYTGDGSSGLYLWGLQFEADQPVASSYIKTTSTTVTRALELATAPLHISWQEGLALYFRGIEAGSVALASEATEVSVYGGGASIRIRSATQGAGYSVRLLSGAAASNTASLAPPTIGQPIEHLLVLQPTGACRLDQSIDGGPISSVSSAGVALPRTATTTVQINGLTGTVTTGMTMLLDLIVLRGAGWTMDQIRQRFGIS